VSLRGSKNQHTRTLMSTQDRSRHILVHGLLLVMVGLLWGFVVPHTPYPRLALGAHLQFIANGLLIIVMAAMLLKLPHNVGPKSAGAMLLAAWLIWPMVLSEAANAWWGTTQMLPIAASQASATGGAAWHELVVKLTHMAAGLGLVAAWGLLVAGFVKKAAAAGTPNGVAAS
jgi:hydroxylaminobenzene mutase